MRERMIEKGYTTLSLAKALGLDNSTVWRWVNNRGKPQERHVLKLIELGILDRPEDTEKLQAIVKELRECLFWYVDTDESTEEDEFYWEGKQRAIRALELK